MKRFALFHPLWPAVVLLAGLILIMSLTSAQALPTAPSSPDILVNAPGVVEGYLYEPDGTTPVESGWIHVENVGGQPWMGTDTDPAGHFEIHNLPPGDYTLQALPPEGSPYAASLPQEVEVRSGEWSSLTLRLTEVRISGYVRDCEAFPEVRIEGAPIAAHFDDWAFQVWDSTNISGEFKLGGVATDTTYFLQAFAPPESEYVPLEPITVTPIVTDVILELCIPPVNVQGVVNDPIGNPVGKAWVAVWNDSASDEAGTNVSGTFSFRGLPLDGGSEFWLHAGPPWGGGDAGLVSIEPFTINVPAPPLSATVVITLPYAFKTVTGHVVFAGTSTGVPDAEVAAHRLDGPGFAGTTADASGAYTLGLTGGEWHLIVQPSISPAEWVWLGQPAWVVFDQNTTPQTATVDFEVVPTNAWVVGQVLCPGEPPVSCAGDPPPEAIHVELRNDDVSNGAPLLPGYDFQVPIPDGWYELVAHVDHELWQGPEPLPVFLGPSERLTLTEPIVLRPKDARIEGRVRDELGVGIAGVPVVGWRGEEFGWGQAETDANGDYSMPVVEGEWFVEPQPGPGMPHVFNQGPQWVRVASGGTMAGIDFVLSDGSSRIEGVAVDSQSHDRIWGLDGWASAGIFNAPHDPIHYSDAPMGDGGFELKVKGGEDYWVGLDVAPHAPYVSGGSGPVPVLPGGHNFITVPLQHKDALIEGELIIAGTSPPEPALGVWAEVFGEHVTGQHWVVANVDPDTAGFGLGVISGTWGLRAWVDPESGYVAMPTTTLATVSSGGTTLVDFEVWPITSLISGTVMAPDGAPLEALVFAEGYSPFVGYFDTQGWSDENGYYELLVPEGEYVVGTALPEDELSALGWLNPPPIDVPWVTTAYPSPENNLRFVRLDGEIHGTISFASGLAVTATHPAYVWGWSESGEWAETEALPSGINTFTYTMQVVSNTVWHIGAVYEDWDNGLYYESPEAVVTVGTTPPPVAQAHQDLQFGGPWLLPQPFIISFDGTKMQTIQLHIPPDRYLELIIPPGALADSGAVTLFIMPTYELRPEPRHENVGAGYEMWAVNQSGQEITEFNTSITAIFPYPSDAELAALGVQEHLLVPVYYSTLAGHWILADSYTVDTEHNEIVLQLSHFTKFGALSTEPAEFTIYLPVVLSDNS